MGLDANSVEPSPDKLLSVKVNHSPESGIH